MSTRTSWPRSSACWRRTARGWTSPASPRSGSTAPRRTGRPYTGTANNNIWSYNDNGGPTVDGAALDFSFASGTWNACTRDSSWTNGVAPDSIGIAIEYSYPFVTPLGVALNLAGSGGGLPISDRTVMALNPGDLTDMQPNDLDRHTSARTTDRRRGQVIVIFAGAMLLFAMLAAAVIDVSWYWTNNLRMQRAADAAALAGVVFLPGDPTSAINAARDEAEKNGFEHGTAGVVVDPVQDPTNNRRLIVTINANVGTFFARVAGITSWPASRTSKSEFVLPVPMGSPENYYGVFGMVRTPGGGITETDTDTGTTSYFDPSSAPGGNWTNAARAYVQDSVSPPTSYATRNTNTDPYQVYGGIPDGGSRRRHADDQWHRGRGHRPIRRHERLPAPGRPELDRTEQPDQRLVDLEHDPESDRDVPGPRGRVADRHVGSHVDDRQHLHLQPPGPAGVPRPGPRFEQHLHRRFRGARRPRAHPVPLRPTRPPRSSPTPTSPARPARR